MRKMSRERRQVVVLAASLASISGSGVVLTKGHPAATWMLLGVEAVLMAVLVVKMWRLGRSGGCCE